MRKYILTNNYLLRLPFIINTLVYLNLISFSQTKQLLFVFTSFRHGARAIFDNLDPTTKEDLYKEKWEYEEELTPVGMRMHYLLGYQNQLNYKEFFNQITEDGSNKLNNRQLLVLSTNSTRTIQSANSFLLGLFNDGTGKILDTNQVAKEENYMPPVIVPDKDELINKLSNYALPNQAHYFPILNFNYNTPYISVQDKCYNRNDYIKNNVKTEAIDNAFSEFREKHLSILENIFDVTEKDEITNRKIHSSGDSYISDYTDNRKLEYLTKMGVDLDSYYNDVIDLISNELLNSKYDDNNRYYLARLASSKIFSDIIYDANKVSNAVRLDLEHNESKAKKLKRFVVFSAHDDDLSAYLNFLKYSLGTELIYANYASQIVIELVALDKNEQNLFIEYKSSLGSNMVSNFDISNFETNEIDQDFKSYIKISFDGKQMYFDSFEDFDKKISKASLSNKEIDDYCSDPNDHSNENKGNVLQIFLIVLICLFGITSLITIIIIFNICSFKIEIEEEMLV